MTFLVVQTSKSLTLPSSASPTLIVGLGNPGNEYDFTRHNIGFLAVEALADHYGAPAWKKKFKGLIAAANDPALLFLKPQTYMNLSGEAVLEAAHFHKIAPANIIVFHDDLDLLPGQVKIKQGGGAGGHNGLKSIDQHLGKDYWRVRLGIGNPGVKGDAVTNYVLGAFAKADKVWLEPLLETLVKDFGVMLEGKPNDYQSSIARKMNNVYNAKEEMGCGGFTEQVQHHDRVYARWEPGTSSFLRRKE
jgi:PTH1 family peptidyl-tRNA hydrolase